MRVLPLFIFFAVPAGLWLWAGSLVLRLHRARQLHYEAGPWLQDALFQLSRAAGISPPLLFVIERDTPNAFTLRRGRRHAIVLTRAALATLSPEQVRAVLAHEVAHVAQGHTGRATAAALLVAVLERLSPPGEGSGRLHSLFHRLGAPLERELAADRLAAHLLGDAQSLHLTLRQLWQRSQGHAADLGMPFTAPAGLNQEISRRLRALKRLAARQRRDAARGIYVRRRRRRSKFFPASSAKGHLHRSFSAGT